VLPLGLKKGERPLLIHGHGWFAHHEHLRIFVIGKLKSDGTPATLRGLHSRGCFGHAIHHHTLKKARHETCSFQITPGTPTYCATSAEFLVRITHHAAARFTITRHTNKAIASENAGTQGNSGWDAGKQRLRITRHAMQEKLDSMQEKLDSMQEKLDAMQEKLDSMQEKLDAMQEKLAFGKAGRLRQRHSVARTARGCLVCQRARRALHSKLRHRTIPRVQPNKKTQSHVHTKDTHHSTTHIGD